MCFSSFGIAQGRRAATHTHTYSKFNQQIPFSNASFVAFWTDIKPFRDGARIVSVCISGLRAPFTVSLTSKSSSACPAMSDKREATLAAIQAQGDLVRTLKAAKEAPEKVYKHIRATRQSHGVYTYFDRSWKSWYTKSSYILLNLSHKWVSSRVFCNVNVCSARTPSTQSYIEAMRCSFTFTRPIHPIADVALVLTFAISPIVLQRIPIAI